MASMECDPSSTVQSEWAFYILPAFKKSYPNGDFPVELMVIPGNTGDAFGSPGLVAVDESVAAESMRGIRLFTLAHETAHCVVYLECEKQNIPTPNTDCGANKQKHEMMADLIAAHVLKQHIPALFNDIKACFDILAVKLGPGDEEHPSGDQRVQLLGRYANGVSFNTLFRAVASGHG